MDPLLGGSSWVMDNPQPDIQVPRLSTASSSVTKAYAHNDLPNNVQGGLYVGDEHGVSVLKHEKDIALLVLPYHISARSLTAEVSMNLWDQTLILISLMNLRVKRVLIAYESGLIILWDILEAQVVVVRGDKKTSTAASSKGRKTGASSNNVVRLSGARKLPVIVLHWSANSKSQNDCDGQLFVYGGDKIGVLIAYESGLIILWDILEAQVVVVRDGDVMFWKTSTTASSKGRKYGASSNDVVRLSGARKLPVIVMHWSTNSKSQNDCDGQLFVYGGDEIGSEEFLTVSSID
ncbi:hypothetical protein CTI12_AA447530 [Artemisia annua]|uniref:Uncharacterized protein n=1 Tax=Artemisia annua TaxID=35608 RepID=A0A2U1LV61_ARTAN|nr:hypothetical protein CTI12_AA447530 [Artemisia annua]